MNFHSKIAGGNLAHYICHFLRHATKQIHFCAQVDSHIHQPCTRKNNIECMNQHQVEISPLYKHVNTRVSRLQEVECKMMHGNYDSATRIGRQSR